MNNSLLYILISVVAILVIIVVYLLQKRKNDTTSPKMESLDKNLLDQLYGEISSLKSEKENLKTQVKKLDSLDIAISNNKDSQELVEKLVEVQNEKEDLLVKLKTIEIDYQEKLSQLKDQLASVKMKVGDEFSTTNQNLEKELLRLKEEIKNLQNEIEDLNQDLKVLKTELNKEKIDLENVKENFLVSEKERELLLIETESLKKKIDDSEEEIDELEEEIDDLNIKLKREKQEIEELEDKVRMSEKEKDTLSSEKLILIEELDGERLKLENKNNSLYFVNEILEAQVNDREEDNENLLLLDSYIYNDILDLFNQYYKEEYIEEIRYELWRWTNMERKTWLKSKKVIAIVGEFSAGKTSLVNRILSQDDPNAVLLPVSSKETTAIPTYISNGIDFNCQFYSATDSLNNIKKETFEMVTKSVLDDVKVSSLIKYFVVSYKNKYLENVSILDTPGFASNSSDIIKRTTDIVKESDAVFWVVDANTGDLNQSSLNVMKKNLHDIPLYIIINKCDTKSPSDLKILEDKIKKTLGNQEVEIKAIVQFSKDSNIQQLVTTINAVSIKEQFDIISHIREQFIDLSEFLDKEHEQNRSNNNIISSNINSFENDFKLMNNNINYYLEEIESCINYKDPFFGSDYYRIEKADHAYFKKNMIGLSDNGNSINEYIPQFKKEVEDSVQINLALNDSKHSLQYVNNVKDRFEELVNNYK